MTTPAAHHPARLLASGFKLCHRKCFVLSQFMTPPPIATTQFIHRHPVNCRIVRGEGTNGRTTETTQTPCFQTNEQTPYFHPLLPTRSVGHFSIRPPPNISGFITALAVTYACHRYPTAAGIARDAGSGIITVRLASETRAITFAQCPWLAPSGRDSGPGLRALPAHGGIAHGRLRTSQVVGS